MTKNEIELVKKALFNIEMTEVKCMDSFPQIDLPHSQQYIEKMNSLTCASTTLRGRQVFSKKKILICIIVAILTFVTA